jgi:uncharacterized protein
MLNILKQAVASHNEPLQIEIPLFTLGSILFPEGRMNLRVFEQRYMDMAKSCIKNAAPFGVVLIANGEEVNSKSGITTTPVSVGTLATIADWDMQQLGVLQLTVEGGKRFRIITHRVLENGLLVGTVSLIDDDAHQENAALSACANLLQKILSQLGKVSGPQKFHDAMWVSCRLTEMLPLNMVVKQKMLELTDAGMRLDILHKFLIDQGLIAAH